MQQLCTILCTKLKQQTEWVRYLSRTLVWKPSGRMEGRACLHAHFARWRGAKEGEHQLQELGLEGWELGQEGQRGAKLPEDESGCRLLREMRKQVQCVAKVRLEQRLHFTPPARHAQVQTGQPNAAQLMQGQGQAMITTAD